MNAFTRDDFVAWMERLAHVPWPLTLDAITHENGSPSRVYITDGGVSKATFKYDPTKDFTG